MSRGRYKKYSSFDFEQLDNCGWTWSSDPTDLRISNELVINGEPHKLTLGKLKIYLITYSY